jgi:hypothetical protein
VSSNWCSDHASRERTSSANFLNSRNVAGFAPENCGAASAGLVVGGDLRLRVARPLSTSSPPESKIENPTPSGLSHNSV